MYQYYLFVQRTEKCHSKQNALCTFEHEKIILFVQTTLFQTKQAALEQVVFLYQVYIHQIETSLIEK